MMRWRAVVLICALLLPAAAAAQQVPLDRPPANYGDYRLPETPRRGPLPHDENGAGVTWLLRPSSLPFTLFFPHEAQEQVVNGFVALDCEARADQRLDCEALSETPQGWGFAAAALAMSRSFRARPTMRNGHVIGHPHVRVPINFRLADAEDDPNTFELPQWEAAPNADAVRAAWTEGAAHPNTRGRAVLNCTVNADRTLNCGLLRESQEGLGFGRAALALALQFRVAGFDTDFIEHHRATPFLMPVNFGFAAAFEPLNRFSDGETPIHFPTPPPSIVRSIYPQAARAANISGDAVATCTVHESGAPVDCVITSETPEGHGFGAAAQTLASRMMAMTPFEALLPGDKIEFHVPFELSQDVAPSAAP